MAAIEIAMALIKGYALCDNCLGRQFAMLGHSLSNEERGKALKIVGIIDGCISVNNGDSRGIDVLQHIAINGFSKVAFETLEALDLKREKQEKHCFICKDAFKDINDLVKEAIKKLSDYEYDNFLVGVETDAEAENREDLLRSKFGIKWGESIRNEFSRETGKRIVEKTKKNVNLKRPDILIIINPFKKKISLEINSLFVSGRYRKLVRGISQSRWICNECLGKGCQKCNWNGRMYSDSIEELIILPLIKMANGDDGKLHASGREDVDVKTLGAGRPFIAEVKKPKLRNIDLNKLRDDINLKADGKIEVNFLNFSSKKNVRDLKEDGNAIKVYRAIVEFIRDLTENEILGISELGNRVISQLTPIRVSHRRAIKTRKKYLYKVGIKKLKPNLVELLIRCEGGLYVKELINGDEDRTKPSVTEIVGVPAKCIELDVMAVELEAF